MVIVELTSTLSQCDAVLPVLQLVSLTSCFNSLQILSVDNEIQFHQLHHLKESYQLKGPPSSQLYRTVSKSNDMKGPPSSQLYRTVSKSNDIQGAFFWDYSGYSYSGLGITEYTEFQFRKERQFWKRNTHGGGDLRTTMSAHARATASDFPPKISQKNAYSVYSE